MIDIPTAVMDALWALVLALIAAIIAYIEKMDKAAILKFMDPKDTTVVAAPEGVPPETYVMGAGEKATILAGKNAADAQNILAQIETAEKERLATYTITWSGGSWDIEYGYIKTQITNATTLEWAEIKNIEEPKDATRPLPKVNDETFKWLMAGLPETEAASVRAQVGAAEAKGLRQFTVTTSRWVFLIDNGLVVGDKDLRPGG